MGISIRSRLGRGLGPWILLLAASCASDDYGGEVVPVSFHYQYPGVEGQDQPPGEDEASAPKLESWVLVTQVWAKREPPGPHSLAWDSDTEEPTEEQMQRLRKALGAPGIRRVHAVPSTLEIETEEHYWVVLHGTDLHLVRFNPEFPDDRDPVVHLERPRP